MFGCGVAVELSALVLRRHRQEDNGAPSLFHNRFGPRSAVDNPLGEGYNGRSCINGYGEVECLLLSGNSVWIICRTS